MKITRNPKKGTIEFDLGPTDIALFMIAVVGIVAMILCKAYLFN